jgi:rhodanese-related sulfurtransferase
MPKILFLLLVAGAVVIGYYYWHQPASTKNSKPSLIILNVLDKEEYDDCHIKGSMHVNFEHVEEFAQKLDKNSTIVVYCTNYMCTSSDYVAKKLREKGFDKVFVYAGGMAEWHQKQLPVVGQCKAAYLQKVVAPSKPIDEEHITAEQLLALIEKTAP